MPDSSESALSGRTFLRVSDSTMCIGVARGGGGVGSGLEGIALPLYVGS